MFYQLSALAGLASVVFSQTTPAPIITDNHYGAAYSVALVDGPGPLVGTFDFKASTTGVNIAFNVNGFNTSEETTYTYHIHEKPVPSNGNCNATGDHFDPYHVGAAHKCVPSEPSMCQLGDLSGKHGPIAVNASSPAFATAYQDDFLSTNMGDIAFFANLSIVVHRKKDNYRLNCGNFKMYGVPVVTNSSAGTVSNLSTTVAVDSSMSTSLAATSAISISSNTTITASSLVAPTLSGSAQSTQPVGTKTSSGMSLQTGNDGSRRVEAGLLMLGAAAVVPMVFL